MNPYMNTEAIPNGITLNALRAFLNVAENGGYWPAAKRVHNTAEDVVRGTAANLKNQVKRLADGLGVPLTQKHGSGIVLTARGQELQRVAAQVLQLLSDFRAACEDERQLVRLGGGQSLFDEWFLPRWAQVHVRLARFRFQFQNLRTADTIAQLREQRLDFGLVRQSAVEDGLESAPLGTLRFALFVPKGLVKNTGSGMASLPRTLPMATISGDGEFRSRLGAFAMRHRKQFHYVMECTSQAQVREFLLTGTVAAVLPDSESLRGRDLVRIPVEDCDGFHRETMLVWLPGRLRMMPDLGTAKDALLSLEGRRK